MANASPAVSVLIPVYNAGKYLALTVKSVLAQTFRDLELLLIDDGSTDDAMSALSAASDPRLSILRQDRQGAAAALNAGLARARGEIIAFLDHDDLWLPEKLQLHLDCFAAYTEADLTFDWSRMIDEHGRDLDLPSRCWQGTISFQQLLCDFVIGNTSAICARKGAIERAGRFDPSLWRTYDADLCLRIAAQRLANCRAVPRHLTYYRRHPGQMSRDWRSLRTEWESLLGKVRACAPCPVDSLLPIADSNMHRYFAWLACEAEDYGNALRLASMAFRRAPRHAAADVRNWLMLAAVGAGYVLPEAAYRRAAALGKSVWRTGRTLRHRIGTVVPANPRP